MIPPNNISNGDAIHRLICRTKHKNVSSGFTDSVMHQVEIHEQTARLQALYGKISWLFIVFGVSLSILFLPIWTWAGINTSIALFLILIIFDQIIQKRKQQAI